MLIQCTKKLLDELKIKQPEESEENPLFSWYANVITVNRRKTVVLVNDKNRYIIVLYGLKAKDFKKLNEIIIEAIREIFKDECIKDEIINDFIKDSKEIIYGKTKDRKMIAKMNKTVEDVLFEREALDISSIIQSKFSRSVSTFMVDFGRDEHKKPNEEMYKDLEEYAGHSIFQCKAVELDIKLELESEDVWRKLIIPCNATFKNLHNVIQIAFEWYNYHLHEFYIYEKGDSNYNINNFAYHRKNYKAILGLVCDEQSLDYKNDDMEMKQEDGILLSDYIPAYENVKYIYDFGDCWNHYIEVSNIIENYPNNYPVCIDGKGKTPPEDVGGSIGYEEFLQIIEDKTQPDYESMKTWAESQGFKEFDIEEINRMLKLKWKS